MDRIGIGPGPFQADWMMQDDARTGTEGEVLFEGSILECQAKRAVLRAQGASHIVLKPKGDGNYIVQGQFPFDIFNGGEFFPAPAVNELEIEVAQQDVATSPKLRSLVSDRCIGAVRGVSDDFLAKRYAIYNDDDPPIMTESGIVSALKAIETMAGIGIEITLAEELNAKKLFINLALRGVTSFLEYHTVYRKTLTAASPLQVQASYTGAGQIWTTAEVLAWEQYNNPNWFSLPAISLWLKSPPTVQSVARQKTQVIYSYTEIRNATALLYDAYGSAVLLDA